MASRMTSEFPRPRTLIHPGAFSPVRIHSQHSQRARHVRLALQPVLDRLEGEHERSEKAIRELERALVAWEVVGEARRESCQLMLQAHANTYLGHMEVEENYVLPVALDYLSPLDWRELADALATQRSEHDASMLRSHEMLFERITCRPAT